MYLNIVIKPQQNNYFPGYVIRALEAEMDGEPVYLSKTHAPICVAGLATCYGFIITNGQDTAALHVSSLEANLPYLENILKHLKNNSQNNIHIILVRSFRVYEEEIAQENQVLQTRQEDVIEEMPKTAQTFFNEMDARYTRYLTEKFNIKPDFLDAPHGLFVININGKIDIFKPSNHVNFYECTSLPTESHECSEEIKIN